MIEKDGEVYVKAEEKTLKAQRRQPYGKCTVKGQEEVVVVGGGSACFGVIEGLRTNGFTGKITVLSAEPSPPFDRTKLSKAMLSDVSKLEMRSISALADAGIEFLAKTEVTAVDTTKKTVTTKAGKSYGYTKLVLATGGAPNRLPLEGLKGDLGNVFTLRYLTDVKDITAAIGDKGGKKITVIGSSFIGMEAAYCLVGKGHEVTVIGTESVPLERVLGKEIGKIIQTNATKAKINVLMDATVEKGSPSSSNPKMIGSVGLKGGKTIECDLVILGVGVKPATAFLKENSSFKLLKDQSLEVDETFQVKGLKDVYAAGDIATYPYHGPGASKGGSPVRIE